MLTSAKYSVTLIKLELYESPLFWMAIPAGFQNIDSAPDILIELACPRACPFAPHTHR